MKYQAITVTELNKYIKEKIGADEFLKNALCLNLILLL